MTSTRAPQSLRAVSRPTLALVAILAAGCRPASPDAGDGSATEAHTVPATLVDLTRVEHVTGDDARTLIAHLHPGPIATAESDVGFYEAGDRRAVLYVSRFLSADTAQAQVAMMALLIRRGRGGFGHHVEMNVGSVAVHAALGQGRAHFFFARDADVVWLAADPDLGRAALAELLGVPPDSIPPSGSSPDG